MINIIVIACLIVVVIWLYWNSGTDTSEQRRIATRSKCSCNDDGVPPSVPKHDVPKGYNEGGGYTAPSGDYVENDGGPGALKPTKKELAWKYDKSKMNEDCGSCEDVKCTEMDIDCGAWAGKFAGKNPGGVTNERCAYIKDKKDQKSGRYDHQRCGTFHCCSIGPMYSVAWRSPWDRRPAGKR